MTVVVVGQFRLPPERMDEARGAMRKVMEARLAALGIEPTALEAVAPLSYQVLPPFTLHAAPRLRTATGDKVTVKSPTSAT